MAINGYEKLIMIMRNQAKQSASSGGSMMIGEVNAQGKIKIGALVLDQDDVEKLEGVTISADSTVLCTFIDDDVYIIGKVQE